MVKYSLQIRFKCYMCTCLKHKFDSLNTHPTLAPFQRLLFNNFFCRSLFVLLYFLCCLFVFHIRILITPLISSKSSCLDCQHFVWNMCIGIAWSEFERTDWPCKIIFIWSRAHWVTVEYVQISVKQKKLKIVLSVTQSVFWLLSLGMYLHSLDVIILVTQSVFRSYFW